jgi:HK97 family phage major capsid protein
VTLNAANSPTWANIVAMETEVSTDNALGGSLAYLTTPVIAGAMKVTDKGTDTGQFVLGGDNSDGKLNGYRCAVSNNVPEKHILFGNWADVIVGFWSGMDILVDPYTNSAKGEIIVQVFLDVDVALRHAESMCKGYKA